MRFPKNSPLSREPEKRASSSVARWPSPRPNNKKSAMFEISSLLLCMPSLLYDHTSVMIWPLNYVTALLCSTYIPFFIQVLMNVQCTSCLPCSVADPGCLSLIPDPDFYPSRIPDLGSRIKKQQQKRGVKKNLMSYLSM